MDDSMYKEVKEGKAAVLYPVTEAVFYNPVQQFNRDLSILTIKEFLEIYKREDSLQNRKQAMEVVNNDRREIRGHQTEQITGRDCKGESKFNENGMQAGSKESKEVNLKGSVNSDNVHRPIRILEGLAATGLRSIRYALEVNGIDEIFANDFSPAAFENIKRNIDYNAVGEIVKPSLCDAG